MDSWTYFAVKCNSVWIACTATRGNIVAIVLAIVFGSCPVLFFSSFEGVTKIAAAAVIPVILITLIYVLNITDKKVETDIALMRARHQAQRSEYQEQTKKIRKERRK